MAYNIDPHKLDVARARLIERKGHDVSWSEFAAIVGVTLNTISNIRHGRSTGSSHTIGRVVNGLLREGVQISYYDLLSGPSTANERAKPKQKVVPPHKREIPYPIP